MTFTVEKNGTGSGIEDDGMITESAPIGGLESKEILMFKWRALLTVGGLYGLTICVMGIVIPFTYFLKLWSDQKFHYFYAFYFYVFMVALIFMIYVSVMTSRLKGKTGGQDQHGHPLPAVLVTGEGANIYLTFAIIVFGSLSILLQVLIFVAYGQDPLQFQCYGYGQITTSILLILFIGSQMVFFLGHSKTVFNFKPMLMKLGFSHLIAANMCTWGLAIMFESAESYLHSLDHHGKSQDTSHDSTIKERHARAADNDDHGSSPDSDSSESFVFTCLKLDTTVTKALPYLVPFMVEFSLIAVAIVYGMFKNVGTRPHSHQLKLIDKKHEESLNQQQCAPYNCVTYCHWLLVLVAIGVIIVHALVGQKVIDVGEYMDTVTTALFFGIQYFFLVLSIVFTIAAAFQTRKCHYIRHNPESFFDEMLLLVSLGGLYFIIAFVLIASIYSASAKPQTSPIAELYIALSVLNYVQSTMQVVFIRDGLRRKALTRSALHNDLSKNLIIMDNTCNEGLWIVTSFMLEGTAISFLLTEFYGSLTWIVISSVFMPLAIFFRFHCGACMSEMIESLYHGSCHIGKRTVSAKHWEHKE